MVERERGERGGEGEGEGEGDGDGEGESAKEGASFKESAF